MNKFLLHALSVFLLIVPSISQAAAMQTEDFSKIITSITWINTTTQNFQAFLVSTNKAYEDSKEFAVNPTLNGLSSMIDETIKGYGPYKIIILEKRFAPKRFVFTIPTISGPTDIRITENPKWSENFEVWYRPSQPIEGRQQALTIMETTHPRTGAKAPALGGEIGSSGRGEIYKQIAEHLMPEPWKKAERLK